MLGTLSGFMLGRGPSWSHFIYHFIFCRLLNLTLYDTVMTSRGQVRLDNHEKALKEDESGTSLKQVVRSSEHTCLKRSSLQRYRKKVTALGSQSATMGHHKGVLHVLSLDMNKALAKYVVDLSAKFFGLTVRKLCILAFEFTAQNKLAAPESWKSRGMAGRRWLQYFLTRNNLSMRKPEPTSLSRATAINPISTKSFFDNLNEVLNLQQTIHIMQMRLELERSTLQVLSLTLKARSKLEVSYPQKRGGWLLLYELLAPMAIQSHQCTYFPEKRTVSCL